MKYSNLIIFVSELLGTFGLLVAATGSIVYDSSLGNRLGPIIVAAIHFLGLAIVVYAFGKYSMAHFNPAVKLSEPSLPKMISSPSPPNMQSFPFAPIIMSSPS